MKTKKLPKWILNKHMNIYNMALKHIENAIGHNGTTWNDRLHRAGKNMFGKKFSGVYPSDDIKWKKGSIYAIVNLDGKYEPGSHWTLVIKDGNNKLFYDSFGRKASKIMPSLNKGKGNIINTELDPEQDIKENNCGQRSLAACFVYDQFGREMFLKL